MRYSTWTISFFQIILERFFVTLSQLNRKWKYSSEFIQTFQYEKNLTNDISKSRQKTTIWLSDQSTFVWISESMDFHWWVEVSDQWFFVLLVQIFNDLKRFFFEIYIECHYRSFINNRSYSISSLYFSIRDSFFYIFVCRYSNQYLLNILNHLW